MKKIRNLSILKNLIWILGSYVLVTFLLSSGLLNRQYTSLLVPIGINIMLAVSLNLVTGFLGELSLGHAGFMSIGAYTSALITTSVTLPELSVTFPWFTGMVTLDLAAFVLFLLALLAGGILAALAGFLIGVPVLRLRGDYLAIVTLAFGEIIKSIINSLSFTNGARGLSKIPLYSNYKHYTLVFFLVILTILLITNLVHSRDGRAVTSIRDNDIAAESIGINVSRYKVATFVIASFFAGLAGALYAHNVSIIKPVTFDYNKSIEILVIVVLGGMGSIRGSVIAAIVMTILPELLRGADSFRMLLYAVVLIVMMIFNHSRLKAGMMNNHVLSKLFGGRKEAS